MEVKEGKTGKGRVRRTELEIEVEAERSEVVALLEKGMLDEAMEKAGPGALIDESLPCDARLEKSMDLDRKKISGLWKRLPHFMQSPLEIVMRSADDEAFEKAFRSAVGHLPSLPRGTRGSGWTSRERRHMGFVTERDMRAAARVPCIAYLLVLALMLGRTDRARALVRLGWIPSIDGWRLMVERLGDFLELAERPEVCAEAIGVSPDDILQNAESAIAWIKDGMARSDRLDGLCDQSAPDLAAIQGLLDEGTPVGPWALFYALGAGNRPLVRLLLEAGADPNGDVKGQYVLVRAPSKSLSPELLQDMLDAGAICADFTSEFPFGEDTRDMPLARWAWDGRTDLMRQALDGSRAPIQVYNVRKDGSGENRRWSPLLATALSRGHAETAFWLCSKGARLDDLDDETEEPCSSCASEAVMAEFERLLAESEGAVFEGDARKVEAPEGGRRRGP